MQNYFESLTRKGVKEVIKMAKLICVDCGSEETVPKVH